MFKERGVTKTIFYKKGKDMTKNKQTYSRKWVERQIADRLGFYYCDVADIFNEFENILKEIIAKEESLRFTRIFTMYLTKMKRRKGYNVDKKKYEKLSESRYVSFRASKALLSKAKNENPIKEND